MSKPGSPTGVLTFHNAIGSYGGLAGRPRGTGHEKGRDVPAFSFLCKPRPAGIRTLGFEARGKTGARDPGVDIEDPHNLHDEIASLRGPAGRPGNAGDEK